MRALGLLVGMVACALTAHAADVTTLLYASPYGPAHPFSRADETWIAWVAQRSGGSLRINPIWSGALLSSDESLIELRHGVADIGLITPIYAKGGATLLRAQDGFYAGATTYAQQVEIYSCLAAAQPEFAHELTGLHLLAVQGGSLPGILTRTRRVSSLEDLKGLRLRAPNELLDVLRDLGADPVNMPMGDVYSALAKGVIDGLVAPDDTLKALHFSEVVHYAWGLQIPRGAYPARAMGEQRWQRLSVHDRAVLDAGRPVWEAALAKETADSVAAGEAQGRRDGVSFSPASSADQAHFNSIYEKEAQRSAQSLRRYGIDGPAVLAYAHELAQQVARTGQVQCRSSDRPAFP